MTMMRAFLGAVLLAIAAAVPASAVTPDELAALARAGLGDEVLLALVEATGVDQAVNASQAVTLRRAGVSERVIAAAIRASHRAPDPPAPDPVPQATACVNCEPTVAVIGAPPPVTVIEREIYYVPVWTAPIPRVRPGPPQPYLSGNRKLGRFINDGFADRTPRKR